MHHVRMSSHPVAQNPDIRFLGKLLGDVIREHGGERLFGRIEAIRAASVDQYRGVADASATDAELDALDLDDTLAFVRGFMLFSLLANLAEDRQGIAAEPDAGVARAIGILGDAGIGVDADGNPVSPPTVVSEEDGPAPVEEPQLDDLIERTTRTTRDDRPPPPPLAERRRPPRDVYEEDRPYQ